MLIKRGAEAIIEKKDNEIIKYRISKGYRIKELDEALRKERTKKEARIMTKLHEKIAVPKILEVKDYTIVMEFIDGELVVNIACDKPEIFKQIGELVGKMHSLGIYHGDLTTSNLILKEKVYLIDFGLAGYSQKVEDFAVDLHVFKQSLESKHYRCMDLLWNNFLEGYKTFKNYKEVMDRLSIVESRGRYKHKGGKK